MSTQPEPRPEQPAGDAERIGQMLRDYGYTEHVDRWTGESYWREPGQRGGAAGRLAACLPGGEFTHVFLAFDGGRLPAGPTNADGLAWDLRAVYGDRAAPVLDLGLTLGEFLDQPEPDHDWVIPGLLEHGDRVMLTAAEGAGKSTLLRQIAVKAAAGVHPFSDEPIEPVTVLYVDLENGTRHLRRQFAPLARLAGDNLGTVGAVWIEVRSSGIDLLDAGDRDWLDRRLDLSLPDLLVIGPVYKMIGGDPTAEEPAKVAARYLDSLRDKYGVALLMEAHTPYASAGGKRPTRPYGASLWSRWPEFGIHLDSTGALSRWRGDRDQRDWPAALTRGGDEAWPWKAATGKQDVLFARLLEAVRDAGEVPSIKALARMVDAPETTVRRTIDARIDTWRSLTAEPDKLL